MYVPFSRILASASILPHEASQPKHSLPALAPFQYTPSRFGVTPNRMYNEFGAHHGNNKERPETIIRASEQLRQSRFSDG
jgi:hypothetical protein